VDLSSVLLRLLAVLVELATLDLMEDTHSLPLARALEVPGSNCSWIALTLLDRDKGWHDPSYHW